MIRLMLILLFILLILILPTSQSAPVWENGAFGELHWGDSLKLRDYELYVADFSVKDSAEMRALIDVYDAHSLLDRRALAAGESFSINDSLRVVVDEIRTGDLEKEPFVKVRMQLAAVPEVEMTLVTDNDYYEGGEEIKLELRVKNTAAVDAENLRIKIASKPPIFSSSYSRAVLGPGKAWDEDQNTVDVEPIKLKLKAPYLPGPAEIAVFVRADYTDPKKGPHQSFAGAIFRVAGPLQLHKHVEELQEFGKSYFVINTLRNAGNRTLSVELTDSTGEHFETNAFLNWKLQMPPGCSEVRSYRIEAKKPGKELVVPAAKVSYSTDGKRYTVKSESPVVDVFGPYAEVQRSVKPLRVKVGEEITVSTRLCNSGNRKSLVMVEQALPEGTELIEGELNSSFLLAPDESRTLDIILRCCGIGEISLPPAAVEYRDALGDVHRTMSAAQSVEVEELKIETVENEENQTAMETLTKDAEIKRAEAGEEESDGQNGLIAFTVLVLLGLISAALSRYP